MLSGAATDRPVRASPTAQTEPGSTSVGGGSSAAGYCLTVGDLAGASVVGVQSAAAPAMHRAWREGDLSPHDRMETFAEGVATSAPFALTTEVLRDGLEDFLTVPDDALRRWMRRAFAAERVVFEGACAAGLAGMDAMGDAVAGSTVVVPVSGRNVDPDLFRSVLAA